MDSHRVSDSFANYSNLGTDKMETEQQTNELRMDRTAGYYHRSLGIAFILYWTKLYI